MARETSPSATDADTGERHASACSDARDGQIRAGDRVLLTLEDDNTFLVRMDPGRTHSTHKGAIAHDDVIGRPWGSRLRTNVGEPVCALRPTWVDDMMKVDRRTNIMYPKDVSYLLALLGLTAGQRVVELGSGSGAMTQALARAVQPGGRVFSYDLRPEFLELAADNCAAAGIDEGVEFRLREAGEALEPGVDAVFCDIPEPWNEVPAAWEALRGSGRFAAGLPTFNQVEKLAATLEGNGFASVDTLEILHRHILARPGRTRPAHRMVGHTQLLVSAVKVIDPSS